MARKGLEAGARYVCRPGDANRLATPRFRPSGFVVRCLLCVRFPLSLRSVEDLLFQRAGISTRSMGRSTPRDMISGGPSTGRSRHQEAYPQHSHVFVG